MRHVLGREGVFKMFEMEPQESGPLVKPKRIWEEILELIVKIRCVFTELIWFRTGASNVL